jgi:hypothetical protein
MTKDLETQRLRAQELADVLDDYIEDDEDGNLFISSDSLLDALGCCGLTLQEGNDAGMAYMDDIILDVEKKNRE